MHTYTSKDIQNNKKETPNIWWYWKVFSRIYLFYRFHHRVGNSKTSR